MKLAEVSVVEAFINNYLDEIKTIGKNNVISKQFDLYCETAELLAFKEKKNDALRFWQKGIKVNPFSSRAYFGFLSGFLNQKQIAALKWYYSKLRRGFIK